MNDSLGLPPGGFSISASAVPHCRVKQQDSDINIKHCVPEYPQTYSKGTTLRKTPRQVDW